VATGKFLLGGTRVTIEWHIEARRINIPISRVAEKKITAMILNRDVIRIGI
jgi:hypothetical protein